MLASDHPQDFFSVSPWCAVVRPCSGGGACYLESPPTTSRSRMSPTFHLRTRAVGLAVVALLSAGAAQLGAQASPIAFRGARIIPVVGPEIPNGTVVVQGGHIVAVGANVTIPQGARIVDVSGKVIMPGLVDTHSHIGGGAGGDRSDPIQGEVRILDAIDPQDDGIQRAQAGGVTTANIMPGSGHLMSGQTAYVKL